MSVNTIRPQDLIAGIDLGSATSGRVEAAAAENRAYALFREAVDSIKVIMTSYVCVCATSFGKDSTVVMLAAIQALRELIEEGKVPADHPLVFTNIDTGVENHLVQILSLYERDRLVAFGKKQGLNIDMRVGLPPLAKQWASLFLSGLKIISTARVNNDCSQIMKVDNAEIIERQVAKDYGNRVVTLLGSRSEESAKRAASLKKRGQDTLTADDLVECDQNNERVFAPIVSMTTDEVWIILRRAGTKPLVDSYSGNAPIPSFAKNHRLLHMIYSDSKDGTCPTSSKRLKGDSQKAGGCGGSARTGCYLCAKSITDKSGEAQAMQKRHRAISGNILKVRNYIMHVAQDINNRTWHARAVDETTGAVALQPNVLNAKTIDKIIWLLCQATHDDRIRAERFKQLVADGREMDDEGYADIINDPLLSEEDREEFAAVYKQYAQRHLIKPMSADISLFLSLIHSRDGVRLPHYRAMAVWDKTYNGERIPYPDVDPVGATVDDIPDAIMVVPTAGAVSQRPTATMPLTLGNEKAENCEWQPVPMSSRMPMRDANYFLSPKDREKYAHLRPSETLDINFISAIEGVERFLSSPRNVERKIQASRRAKKKVSRKGGVMRITERGRTSLNTYSFKERSPVPLYKEAVTQSVPVYVPELNYQHWTMDYFESTVTGGYQLDHIRTADWMEVDGIERALQLHDETVERRESRGESIYQYSGTRAFEQMMRFGIFDLTQDSKRHAARIIKRTEYFASMGLYMLDDDMLRQMALDGAAGIPIKLSTYRPEIKATIGLAIDDVMDMKAYRSYKARYLLDNVRAPRNEMRRALKERYNQYWSELSDGVCQQLTRLYNNHIEGFKEITNYFVMLDAVKGELKHFDHINVPRDWLLYHGAMTHFMDYFSSPEGWYKLLDRDAVKYFEENPLARLTVNNHALMMHEKMADMQRSAVSYVKDALNEGAFLNTLMCWAKHQNDGTREAMLEALDARAALWEKKDNAACVIRNTFKLNDVSVAQGGVQW